MLNIVLFEPEIAVNTGNIARICVGFNARLHLIRPYGFFLNDKTIKRTSANHWKHLQLEEHDSWDNFLKTIDKNSILYFYTRYGLNQPNSFNYKKSKNIYLVFGKESTGIPLEILKKNKATTIRVPSSNLLRSMNLSNTVAVAAYEVVKQENYEGLCITEPFKPQLK